MLSLGAPRGKCFKMHFIRIMRAYYKTNHLSGDRELVGSPLGPLGLKRLLMFNRSWCEASAVWVGQIKWVWSKVAVLYVQNSLFVLMSLCCDSALKAFCFVMRFDISEQFPTVRGDIFTLLDLSVQQSKTQRCAIYYQRTESTSKYSHLRSLTWFIFAAFVLKKLTRWQWIVAEQLKSIILVERKNPNIITTLFWVLLYKSFDYCGALCSLSLWVQVIFMNIWHELVDIHLKSWEEEKGNG